MPNLIWKSLGLATLVAGCASIAAMSSASATTFPSTPNVAAITPHYDGQVILVSKKKHDDHNGHNSNNHNSGHNSHNNNDHHNGHNGHDNHSDHSSHHHHYSSWDDYHRHHGGHRYTYRHGPYTHYYHGYYYSTPWWTLTVPVPGVVVAPAPGVTIRLGY